MNPKGGPADSAVTIRFRIKVQPLQQWTVRRAFLLRLKKEFDRNGIEIPFPHLTLYPGQARDGSTLPLYLAYLAMQNKPESGHARNS